MLSMVTGHNKRILLIGSPSWGAMNEGEENYKKE
jgi:hypothetical protein